MFKYLIVLPVKEGNQKRYSTDKIEEMGVIYTLFDIVDPLPPQGFAAKMSHDYWDVPKNYILFSTGEGEGGYLYNTEDDSVWDFQIGQLQQLIDGTLPHWNSFYEFIIWYLIDEEDA